MVDGALKSRRSDDMTRQKSGKDHSNTLEQILINEEKALLEELETTNVFNMRPQLKNYIENSVQLHRKGMNLQL